MKDAKAGDNGSALDGTAYDIDEDGELVQSQLNAIGARASVARSEIEMY